MIKIEQWLQRQADRKSYIIYRLLPLSVILNDNYHQIQFDAEYLENDMR